MPDQSVGKRKSGPRQRVRGPGKAAADREGKKRDDAEKRHDGLEGCHSSFDLLVELAPEAIFIQSGDRFRYLNKRMLELFGASSPEELLGADMFERFAPEYHELIRNRVNLLQGDAGPAPLSEQAYLRMDGSRVPVETTAIRIRFEGQDAIAVFVRDITERKKAEKQLAHMHELMQYVISHAQSAIAVHDRDMKYIYVSDQYLQQYKVKEKDVIGKHHYDVFPDLPQKWRDVHQRVLAGAVEGKDEDPYVRDDGTVDWTRWSCRPWYENDGSIGGLIVYTEVITERKRREEALVQREHQLAESQRIAHIGSWEHNLRTNREFWSDELFRLLDLDPGRDAADFNRFFTRVHPDDQALLKASIERTIREGVPFNIEYRFILNDGGIRHIHAQAEIRQDEAGNPVVLSGTSQDISARKKAEMALRESEQRLRTLIDAIPDAIIFKDAAGCHIIANKANEKVLGLSSEMLIGKTVVDLLPPEEAAVCRRNDVEVMKNREIVRDEEHMTGKNGNPRIIDTIKVPLYDDNGHAIGLVGILRDVTDRKQAEEKIRQNEEFIRNILDTVDEGFIVVDRDYRILTVNKAYCSQVGGCNETIIGRHCYEISHKKDRPCYEEGEECATRRTFETGTPQSALHRHKDASGNMLYVETKAFPIKDASGTVTSVIETINNITERHLLEEERLKTQKLESIGTLAGGIAHDFNNLLQGVFGFISMAKLTYDRRENSLAMLEQAEKALHQSVNLTSQLLTFSKGGRPVMKPLSLQPVIENSVRFALSGSRTLPQIEFGQGLWNVNADEGQLGQVIQNIVLNADQAMPLGGVVRVIAGNMPAGDASAPTSLAPARYVTISIEDNGVGIPEQHLSKIFDPYFTTKEKGSGLGLATSYSIIKNHGGLITVSSTVGKGTRFQVYLPAFSDSPAEQRVPVPASPAGLSRARILVMDDEEIIRRLATAMLQELGHDADVAASGRETIAKYREAQSCGRPYALVVLDLTIRGGMGGAETLRKLREMHPTVKAVVSSGYSDQALQSDYQGQGFLAYLKKPYNIDDLQNIVNELLSRSQDS